MASSASGAGRTFSASQRAATNWSILAASARAARADLASSLAGGPFAAAGGAVRPCPAVQDRQTDRTNPHPSAFKHGQRMGWSPHRGCQTWELTSGNFGLIFGSSPLALGATSPERQRRDYLPRAGAEDN